MESLTARVPENPRPVAQLITDSGSRVRIGGLEIAVAAGDIGHNLLSDFVGVSAVLSQRS